MKKHRHRILGAVLFVLYLVLLTYFLFFAEEMGRSPDARAEYSYNLTLFKEIRRFILYRDILGWRAVFLNIFGNVLAFMPFGFLLPLIWKNFRNAKKVVLMGFLMSLAIEICQLFNLRATDIDDLMMNTLGALVGYCCWKVFSLIFRNAGTKCMEIKKSEPVIYMFGGILGLFLLYNWRVFD